MALVEEILTIAELPAVVSRSYADKPALIQGEQRHSYAELERRSNRVAHALRRAGIRERDCVGLCGRESLDSIVLLFATAKAGGVYVNVNWRLADEELSYIFTDCLPPILFVDHESQGRIAGILARLEKRPRVVIIGAPAADALEQFCTDSGVDASDDGPLGLSYDADAVVAQIYTSGTTGRPKGVMLASRSFFAVARCMHQQGDAWIGWTEADISLVCIPLFHVGGLWWLLRSLAQANTTAVLRSFDPAQWLTEVARHRVSRTCIVPAMIQVILREPGCASSDLSSLRTVAYGGSPIAPALLQQAIQRFGCGFVQFYGLTETGNVAISLRPEDHRGPAERLRAAGRPLPGVAVRVLDGEGGEQPLLVPGEIAIRTPARMLGYYNLPEATAATLVDGWVLTGDIGYRDAEGFIYISDRLKDMIIVAGENVYSAEIESVLREHPEVLDAAVIAVPDALWGEAVKAVVVRRPGSQLQARELTRFLRGSLADFKLPKSIDFVEQLPRNASGKLLKNQLREPHWQGHERRVS